MNKKMREILKQMEEKRIQAKGFMDEENKDLEKATKLMDEVDSLQKEFDLEKRLFEAEKSNNAPTDKQAEGAKDKNISGFAAVAKMVNGSNLNDNEKGLILDGSNNENYLVPEDVSLQINELRRQYLSAKDIVTVEKAVALTGSENWEDTTGAGTGLVNFDDGDEIDSTEAPKFLRKTYSISHYGKLIPIGKILAGAEQAQLMSYIDRWFLKNAVLTENSQIFTELKNGKTIKAIKGWKALKKSINVDLDPAIKMLPGACIVTNQTGFAILDEEEDSMGRPILQPNPQDSTQLMFQGLPIKVFPDAQLPNIAANKAPMFYGATKEGCTFKEYMSLEFAVSDHIFFNKNMRALRVIEGFDVVGTDKDAYIYASFEASTTTTA